ncbi:cytochrome P450 [Mycobacterium sp. CPCC 205372]|uniref:Cytochrome P450 n=1 Tax=Mycobacterium hippophais TaxID=3016340 RepID=A0ABT4PL91_9MYCO|nr:cytochrome P450 [Mycobacterium hippophais]MCZ8377337.1 cytochrome P450 [Mycobacterium hippophais]
MLTRTTDDAGRVLADPSAYQDENRLHAALEQLRTHAPVHWVNAPDYQPFWAITRHADIMTVERANDVFTNSPRPVLVTREGDVQQAAIGVKTLIHMDDPEHRKVRAIGTDWFRPRAMRALKVRVDELAKIHVDKMARGSGAGDFVQDVAVNYPLFVIMSLLGIPEADFPMMLKLTQELFGSDDDELQRGQTLEDSLPALMEMFEYFTTLTASRRANPTEDLASAIANARIDGELLSDIDAVSYYLIIATAGHDTTSATISGGLRALIDNPDQLRLLRADMALLPSAVEEMIRWVTPVKSFMRTAARDCKIGEAQIGAGDALLLSYVSGNRDADVFDKPFEFDVARAPNKHIAFGHGVHFCLGAALARMELTSFFAELLPRIKHLELAGRPELTATTFVGGLKHLPIRYSLT